MVRPNRGSNYLLFVGLATLALVGRVYAASPTIKWKDNSNNEQGFRCYRLKTPALPEAKVCEVAEDTETCSSSEAGIRGYCYQCASFNTLGESDRIGTACWFAPTAPGAVTITIP